MPIVEPAVLMDGEYGPARSEEVTEVTLNTVLEHLRDQKVLFEGMLLEPDMVVSVDGSSQPASVSEIAKATLRVLSCTVPAAVPEIVFLSGAAR